MIHVVMLADNRPSHAYCLKMNDVYILTFDHRLFGMLAKHVSLNYMSI